MEKIDNIKFYTEKNHSLKKDWLKYLIHPIKAHWGDGTSEWGRHKESFKFQHFCVANMQHSLNILLKNQRKIVFFLNL